MSEADDELQRQIDLAAQYLNTGGGLPSPANPIHHAAGGRVHTHGYVEGQGVRLDQVDEQLRADGVAVIVTALHEKRGELVTAPLDEIAHAQWVSDVRNFVAVEREERQANWAPQIVATQVIALLKSKATRLRAEKKEADKLEAANALVDQQWFFAAQGCGTPVDTLRQLGVTPQQAASAFKENAKALRQQKLWDEHDDRSFNWALGAARYRPVATYGAPVVAGLWAYLAARKEGAGGYAFPLSLLAAAGTAWLVRQAWPVIERDRETAIKIGAALIGGSARKAVAATIKAEPPKPTPPGWKIHRGRSA
ncbi:MAG: hypothetical protein HN750_16235 [Gemmatimonadales bacterium]|nr:hypothetical protein [Gemmatimonadales bacterium]